MKTYIVFTDDGARYIKAESFTFTLDSLRLKKTGDNNEQVTIAEFMKARVIGVVDCAFLK